MRRCAVVDSHSFVFISVAQVSRKEVTSFALSSELNRRLLRLEWTGEGEPQQLVQKVVLKGSKNSKFLTVCQPPVPLGMNVMMKSALQ